MLGSTPIAFLFFIISSAVCARISKLPPTFEICNRKVENFDKCVGHAVQSAVPQLVKGYPPLGLYSIDPMDIKQINIDQGDGPVSIKLSFKDLKILGLKEVKIESFRSNLSQLKFDVGVFIPQITLQGPYNIDGKVLILPIKGAGQSKLVLDNVHANITIQGDEIEQDAKKVMKVRNFKINIDATKLSIDLENLFNGDKALGNNMNKFLNENWIVIYQELKPSFQDTFGLAFTEISNRIFNKVALTEIFPTD